MSDDRDVAHRFMPSTEPGYEHTCAVAGCGCLEHDEEHTGGDGIDPPPRVYTPDATGRCTVCQRPEAEHSRSGGWVGDEAQCIPVVEHHGVEPAMVAIAQRTAAAFRAEVTAETVTDEQIRALRDSGLQQGEYEVVSRCHQALKPRPHSIRDNARAFCAAAINARAKGKP